MGAYRLLLAILVAASHMGFQVFAHNPGVFAVVSFLIISGFVMTALIEKNYSEVKDVSNFYLDRAIRIYPQFIFYFTLTSAAIWLFLPGTTLHEALNLSNIIPSLAIVPLGLYMFGVTNPNIIPAVWSLGLEAFFYVLIPFLMIYKIRHQAFTISICIFFIACIGIINTDIYGYRLLPGVLFIFLCGSYMHRSSFMGIVIIIAAWLISVALFISITTGFIAEAPYNVEVTLGIVVGIPTVFLLSKIGYHKLDEFFGNISYGVFLNHFLFIYLFKVLGIVDLSSHPLYAVLSMACSFAASLFSYKFIEKPVLKFRHALRRPSASRESQTV